MKFFSLLFALYMLTLSCLPCVCDDDCANENTEQSSNHSNNKQDDNCTPFCSCACCNTLVYNQNLSFQINKSTTFPSKLNFAIANQNFSSYNCQFIWQPPKLS